MSSAWCGRSWLNCVRKASKRACCCSALAAAGFVASCLERQVHPLVAAILLRMAGANPLDLNAEAEPPDGELAQAVERMAAAERNPIVGADRPRQAEFLKRALKDAE